MTTHPAGLQAGLRPGRRLVRLAAFGALSMVLLSGGCGGGGGGGSSTSAGTSPTGVSFLWSDARTWGGTKPVASASVLIPAGMRVVLDEQTPVLNELIVEGELTFLPGAETELRAGVVRVQAGGALLAGTATEPFVGRATVTLSGVETGATDATMGTRGILVSAGGRVELYGPSPLLPWTKLNAHAAKDATTLTLAEAVDWQAGDQIVVAPTQWYSTTTGTERVALAAASGTSLTLGAPIRAARWGRLQYATDLGMSDVPGVFTKKPHADAVDTLDERAEVGNLSRSIVIQGADDAQWQTNGFGAQLMVMGRSSTLRMDGVELRRVGQAGRVGRYPVHWHLLSYTADGAFMGDATGHFVRNSTIWESRNRCLVVHGTNGVTLQNNICYDIKGHAIFLEDAVERRNVIEGNLVLKVRSPDPGMATVEHEKPTFCGASSGFWITNPDNRMRRNAAADAVGHGIWLSYPKLPVKQGAKVPIRPRNLQHGVFEFNTAHSNGMNGLQLECAMTNDAGDLELLAYEPTTDGAAYNPDPGTTNRARFTFRFITTYKNRNGYLNRTVNPNYVGWANADNAGRGFTGAVVRGSTLKHSLVVGRSLNYDPVQDPYPAGAAPQLAVASYHSTLDISENTFINYDSAGFVLPAPGTSSPSGVFGTEDYYLRPVEKGFHRNPGNKLINADPGYRALPPHLQPGYVYLPGANLQWTLAGAIWDPQGYWTTAGNWLVFDQAFFSEAGCTPLLSKFPTGQPIGLSCPGPYYGVQAFNVNRGLAGDTTVLDGGFKEKIEVQRLNATTYAPVGAAWVVERGLTMLAHMRHFAAVRGGAYELRFPNFATPRWVNMTLDNIRDPGDNMLLGVPYDGTFAPSRVMLSTNPDFPNVNNSRDLTAVTGAATAAAGRAAVAAGTGNLYYRDTPANLIWIKLTPLGIASAYTGINPDTDEGLFLSYQLRIQ